VGKSIVILRQLFSWYCIPKIIKIG